MDKECQKAGYTVYQVAIEEAGGKKKSKAWALVRRDKHLSIRPHLRLRRDLPDILVQETDFADRYHRKERAREFLILKNGPYLV